ASPTSPVVSWMEAPAEGLNRLTQVSTQAAAIRPVKMKVPTVEPRIRPRRFMLAMLPTAEAMDT
ncbi:DNA-binding protein, partial [Dysosmobacter welbionis]